MDGLEWMADRLAAALAELDDTSHLVISRLGSDHYVGDDGPNRFVQFARFGDNVRVESVGDRYLVDADSLTVEQHETLERLGWQPPDAGGNHWCHFEVPEGLDDAARLALKTLEEVHGAIYVEQLDFAAGPSILAALGQAAGVDDDVPVCCDRPMTPIVYGMPGRDLMEAAERGDVALGGCVVWEDPPTFQCTICGREAGTCPRHTGTSRP